MCRRVGGNDTGQLWSRCGSRPFEQIPYEFAGRLHAARVAEFDAGFKSRLLPHYEDLPSYFLIDSNLLDNNPVIARLRYPNGVTHFVVICGKEGFDYLIRDPGRGGERGIYALKQFGSGIEAIRFYRKP